MVNHIINIRNSVKYTIEKWLNMRNIRRYTVYKYKVAGLITRRLSVQIWPPQPLFSKTVFNVLCMLNAVFYFSYWAFPDLFDQQADSLPFDGHSRDLVLSQRLRILYAAKRGQSVYLLVNDA